MKGENTKQQKKNTQNTFIGVLLSVLKFMLGNVRKECLIRHY